MNAVWNSYGQLCGCPEIFKKSCKFFCRELDIRVAVIMSPDFTQRGTPAIFPKRVRAQVALQNGADLILELPVCYACAGAQGFAFGAVQLVKAMGCVDFLAFGAEDADPMLLWQAADRKSVV